ncbi:MAG: DUF4932 domain-containing protein [Cyclobacteriaceae bacterium]|nr:DUF4932 domain-containing protein [Cyclobacteriaceae bacterium]
MEKISSPTVILLLVLVILSCQSNQTSEHHEPSKSASKLDIRYSENLETLALIFNLSEAGELQFEKNPVPRSMLARELTDKFAKYKNHKAVEMVNFLVNKDFVDSYDIALSLYCTPLPEYKQYADFPPIYYENDSLNPDQVKQVFKNFNSLVGQFYKDAELANFFNGEGKTLYKKLFDEVNDVRPDERHITLMEEYYGIERKSYTIIVSAFSFNGIGRSKTIRTNDGINVYQFVSSNPEDESDSIDLTNLNSFTIGYTNKGYFREIATHELGHSFFHESLRENQTLKRKLSEIGYLFTDSLKSNMLKQGYIDWAMCFEEHLVRLGEIRIAELLGKKDFAESYLSECTDKRGFIYTLPMKEILSVYESDRKEYSSIEDFIPVLIDELKRRISDKGSTISKIKKPDLTGFFYSLNILSNL